MKLSSLIIRDCDKGKRAFREKSDWLQLIKVNDNTNCFCLHPRINPNLLRKYIIIIMIIIIIIRTRLLF